MNRHYGGYRTRDRQSLSQRQTERGERERERERGQTDRQTDRHTQRASAGPCDMAIVLAV